MKYRSINDFMEFIRHLLQFYMGSRVFGFTMKGWTLDSAPDSFDFLGAPRLFNELTDKPWSLSLHVSTLLTEQAWEGFAILKA